MSKYRKLIAFLVGGVALVLNDFFNLSFLIGMEDQLTQGIILALTGLGVFQSTNAPA